MLLVLGALAAVLAFAGVVWMRLDAERATRLSDERRVQALWLARSAAAAGRAGTREVLLSGGRARVITRVERSAGAPGVTAEVEVPGGGKARVEVRSTPAGQPSGWQESYTRGEGSVAGR
jgi:hypothetical protein